MPSAAQIICTVAASADSGAYLGGLVNCTLADGASSPSRHEPFSPRPLLPRPRTTSDVVAAPREIHGPRTIGLGPKPDAGSHCTVLTKKAHFSLSSSPNADAPWTSSGLARAMSDYEGLGRLANGPDSMKRSRVP